MEVVEQGENGYVFSYSNQDDGITCIQAFANASEDWNRKARTKSRSLDEERFLLENVTSRLLYEIDLNRN